VRSLLVLGLLFVVNLFFFGGPSEVVRYSASPVHREVAANLLRGELALPYPVGPDVFATDLEVRNGRWLTHWGYGVPILQAPFHLFGVFPDRLIFFLFLCAVTASLFFSLKGYLPGPVTAGLATATALSFSLYWLISFRFLVYEQTVAYAALLQLAALALYLRNPKSAGPVAVAVGLSILVRPLGLIFAFVWGWLLRKHGKAYLLAVTPFVLLFAGFNWFRTGSPFSIGLQNSVPYFADQLAPIRFGVKCGSFLEHFGAIARVLFIGATSTDACGFRVEGNEAAPFLGWLCLLLVGGGSAYVAFRQKRGDFLIWLAGVLAMIASFASLGVGFADRYAADVAPLFVIGAALTLLYGQVELRRLPKYVLPTLFTFLFALGTFRTLSIYDRFVESTSTHVPLAKLRAEKPLPSVRSPETEGYRKGWANDGKAGEVTEFFIGLPEEMKSDWRLEVSGERLKMKKAYINGERYAPTTGSLMFRLDPKKLVSKNILVSILWEKDSAPTLSRAEIK